MLEKPCNKIQSSLGSFKFAVLDLPIIQENFEKKDLLSVDSNKNYNQAFEQITLAVLANHFEIMRQAFQEWRESLEDMDKAPHKSDLEKLSWFLFDLRNAHNHTENKLMPKWGKNINIKKFFKNEKIMSFSIDIPFKRNLKFVGFDPQSKKSLRLSWLNIKNGNKIVVNSDYLNKILLLSYYVLELTKKQNVKTLSKFLSNIQLATIDFDGNTI